ncbi:hypothetical protein V2O64_22290 [Verrucomicrobiaceae bacterium 227]
MKVVTLLALLSTPAWAQSSPRVIIPGIPITPSGGSAKVLPQVRTFVVNSADGQLQPTAVSAAAAAAAAAGAPKDPEVFRTELLAKLKFDRTPSGILREQSEARQTPGEEGESEAPAEVVDEHSLKRKQYQEEVESYRRNVVLGRWDEVKAFLATLPEALAKTTYGTLITTLGQPVQVTPRAELVVVGARPHPQKNYFSVDDVLALSDLSPTPPEAVEISRLAKLVPANPTPEFFAKLAKGTRYLGSGSLEHRVATAALLLDSKHAEQAKSFLPDLAKARESKSYRALNILSRYHAEAHRLDLGNDHLPVAWELALEVLADTAASASARAEALYRAVSLVADLEEGSGQDWLRKTFSDPGGEGFEILAAVGTVGSQSRMVRDANFRLEQSRLQSSAAEAVLATEGLDLSRWKDVFTIYALNWLHEADLSERLDQSTSMRPSAQYDPFGNRFYTSRSQTVSNDRNQPNPIPVGDLLDIVPSPKWISIVDDTVRLTLLEKIPGLFLKVKEHQKAFPFIRQVAESRPETAIDLVKNLINVWAENNNPNQQDRYRSSYSYYYGYNNQAQTIPLTRSKQERNLTELAELIGEIRDLGLDDSFDKELSSAFITVHSKAEVWRLEALQSVFGDLKKLDADTVASLIERMRINLAALWPDPKLQEEYKTKRTDKEKDQQVLEGYEMARLVTAHACEKFPESSRLLTQLAALSYEKSNYLSGKQPQADHSSNKRAALDDLARAAGLYAATLPLEDESEESTAAFETWFFASLGSPLLEALKNHHQPVGSEFPKIKAALESLPEGARERHLEKFARTLNSRITNVSPDLKFRFLEAALSITGEHDEMATSSEIYDYYRDLVTEIELVASLDGSDQVGREPFGLFVNLHHTREIERESGGFQRYLQNQNNSTSFSYNFGRPTEDYRDKFEKAARAALEEHFEIISVTFHTDKIESHTSARPGWRTTPYVYFLLKSKGPQIDTIPPLKIDLDFLDTSGYVVLPISSANLPVDSSGEAEERPFRELKVTMTLDEREAEEKGNWYLEVKTRSEGLVPPLASLLELPPAGFELAGTGDQDLQIDELSTQTDDGAPLSSHEYRISLKPTGEAPAAFTFPALTETATAALAAEDAILRQRYVDVDLLPVGETVELAVKPGSSLWMWLLGIGVLIAAGAIWLWSKMSSSGSDESQANTGPALPSQLTPVTLLHWLRRLEPNVADDRKPALQSEIKTLESQAFAKGAPKLELEKIAQTWSA